MVFELRGRRIVLVSLDLLLDPLVESSVTAIRSSWGQKELGLDPSSILVATTHTHGGPPGHSRLPTFDVSSVTQTRTRSTLFLFKKEPERPS